MVRSREAGADLRDVEDAGPYGCKAVGLGANLRDVEDAVPYGVVRSRSFSSQGRPPSAARRHGGRLDKRAAGGVGPYGCKAVSSGAYPRDVEDAVPYGWAQGRSFPS